MKQCSKCKEFRDVSEFYKDRGSKDGLFTQCKLCSKQYANENKERLASYKKQHREKHKDIFKLRRQKHYEDNKEYVQLQNKLYQEEHKIQIKQQKQQYYINNKEQIDLRNRRNKEKNKVHIALKDKQRRESLALYKTYEGKLTVDECVKLALDGVHLEVKCKYCNKYFIPTNEQLHRRLRVLAGNKSGESNLYCSEKCKNLCPVYNQKVWPKGLSPTTSREVDPLVRKLCFEADEWECQRCGSTESLICHHILGYAQYKTLGNDLANVITFCETCHKFVHSFPGCRYVDLRCDLKEEEE